MPFVPSELFMALARMLEDGAAVVPASPGPRGFEPLCAIYETSCLASVRNALDRGDRAVVSFFPEVRVRILALSRVSAFGDPETLFFNVNRPADRDRARELLNRLGPAGPESAPAPTVHTKE
jgi:molybdopterin-guanine dinucleotide biosynthesis protein A